MHKSRMYRCMIARWRRWNTLKFVKGSCGWYQGGKVEVVTSFLAWIKSNICGCVSMSNIILEFVYPIHNLLKGCGCSMIGWILRTEIMVFCEGQKLPLSILPGQGDLMLNLLILICLLVCRWLNHLKNTNTMNGRMKIEAGSPVILSLLLLNVEHDDDERWQEMMRDDGDLMKDDKERRSIENGMIILRWKDVMMMRQLWAQ